MSPALPRLALALALCGPGCKTRLLDFPVDGGAGADLAAGCLDQQHDVDAVPLVSLEAVDGVDRLSFDRAVRVRADFTLRSGCDLPGQVQAEIQPGDATDFITLTAWVWRRHVPDDRCGPSVIVSQMLVLSDLVKLGNMRLDIEDGVGKKVRLVLRLDVSPGGPCTPASANTKCSLDCQCQAVDPAARCLARPGFAQGVCDRPCNEDTDCNGGRGDPGQRGPNCDHAAGWFCAPELGCQSDADCRFGQRCQDLGGGGPRGCRAVQVGPIDVGCNCATDCGFGFLCKRNVDLAFCEIPCAVDGDCPSASRCIDSACIIPH